MSDVLLQMGLIAAVFLAGFVLGGIAALWLDESSTLLSRFSRPRRRDG